MVQFANVSYVVVYVVVVGRGTETRGENQDRSTNKAVRFYHLCLPDSVHDHPLVLSIDWDMIQVMLCKGV